jgi:hypothetical protein
MNVEIIGVITPLSSCVLINSWIRLSGASRRRGHPAKPFNGLSRSPRSLQRAKEAEGDRVPVDPSEPSIWLHVCAEKRPLVWRHVKSDVFLLGAA